MLPGNLTVAFRGTEIPEDLPTGADMLLAGAAYDQIVAMVNWWVKATTPRGQMAQQFRLAECPITWFRRGRWCCAPA